jgi:hypothetical protein
MPVSPATIALIRIFAEHFGKELLKRYQEMAMTGRLDPSLIPSADDLIAGFAELVKGNFLPKDVLGTISTWKPIDDAIASIQSRLNGILGEGILKEDGILGPRTLKRILGTPKCDGSLPHNPTNEVASDQTGLSRLVIRYWHKDLRLPTLKNGSAADVIEQAWETWKEFLLIDVKPAATRDNANVLIFETNQLDNRPFGVLADAHVGPPGPFVQNLRFDIGEAPWDKKRFLQTCVHEMGHLLGLHHSTDQTSIMSAYLNKEVTKPGKVDIESLARIGWQKRKS